MKKILYILITLSYILVGCDKDLQDQPIPEDTYPTILGQWPSGDPGKFSVTFEETLEIEMQFAPSKLCTGIWYIDDVEYTTGTSFSFTPPAIGVYQLRLEVFTDFYKTSRSAIIEVE